MSWGNETIGCNNWQYVYSGKTYSKLHDPVFIVNLSASCLNLNLLKHVKWPGKINFAVIFFEIESCKNSFGSQFDLAELWYSEAKK